MQEYKDLLKRTREHLMTGVSYMVPMVIAGAVPMALALVVFGTDFGAHGPIPQFLLELGGVGMGLFVPVMAAYIAYSIADRAAIAPGLVCGMMVQNGGAGFLGGIIAGLLAGYVTYTVRKLKLQRNLQPIMALVVYPLVSTLICGTIMKYVVISPIASAMAWLTGWLEGMTGAGPIVLGAILGAMIGFDFGGPINKVAYGLSVGLMASGVFGPMGMAGAAISVAPIGMGIATFLAPHLYNETERDSARTALVLGAITISEGAIPFAAMDPFRVILSSVVGSAVAGAIAGGLGVMNHAPLGGVLILPVVENWIGYLIALGVGSIVTALLVNLLKGMGAKES